MNPLTLVKRIQSINSKEASLGISEEASWHAKYKDSAYVFAGGIPYELTEGDLLAIFAQYGEIVDVNLVRDKGTGKSKGFAFIAYEDQRSTILAVDNLNGAQIVGRTIRVDHVSSYKKKEEEDEEAERQKREARGVCRAFQRGECTRGAGCKFSHDEQRAANTGWGPQDRSSKWGHDKFEGPNKEEKRSDNERRKDTHAIPSDKKEEKRSGRHDEPKSGEDNNRREERRLRRREDDEFVPKSREDHYKSDDKELRKHENDKSIPKFRGDDYKEETRPIRHGGDDFERRSRDDDRREEKRSRKHRSESYVRGEQHKGGGDKWSSYGRDSSSQRHRERYDHRHKSDR